VTTPANDLASRLPTGLAVEPSVLLDERGQPNFRDVFGHFARSSVDIATAVTRVRLGTLDLTSEDLDTVTGFRVLVAELNALHLTAEARGLVNDPDRVPRLSLIRGMLESGRLEVRSAPLGGWSPDFTVFADPAGPTAVLTGFHWFERPYPHRGPAFATLHGAAAARTASRRHLELWEEAHDVGPAIWNIISRASRRTPLMVAGSG
jgi:hypothetical protein